ncbi:hypothetical protein CYMTET_5214 [Cymbomonas tetramitiformis]|uniref:Uncharacterized protein n=1 Tax=Cymbomonas tetramitiformis TaxID=36881 RepID=A0AAE0LJA9_9CHLO|nr:hypothetical protein CYMTET_5214 [Cymbomonas tetramitiformis]
MFFLRGQRGVPCVRRVDEYTDIARHADTAALNVNIFTADMPAVSAAAEPSPTVSVSSGEERTGPPDSHPFMPPPVARTFADFIGSTGFTVEAPDTEPHIGMNMLSTVDQPADSNGYATEDTDDEDTAPAQPPTRHGCGMPVPDFGRSFLTTSFVCALFIECAAAASLTASGVSGAIEHVCTAPPVGGAGWSAPAATMSTTLPSTGSPIERRYHLTRSLPDIN